VYGSNQQQHQQRYLIGGWQRIYQTLMRLSPEQIPVWTTPNFGRQQEPLTTIV
jgi:hypothetical protein